MRPSPHYAGGISQRRSVTSYHSGTASFPDISPFLEDESAHKVARASRSPLLGRSKRLRRRQTPEDPVGGGRGGGKFKNAILITGHSVFSFEENSGRGI